MTRLYDAIAITPVMNPKIVTEYIADGAEHTRITANGRAVYKAVMNGNSLRLTGTLSSEAGESEIDQTFSVSSDGSTLTHVSKIGNPRNLPLRNMYRTQVYVKKTN
jgi:hypothetical protein